MSLETSGRKKAFLDSIRLTAVIAMLATVLCSWLNLNSYCIILVLFLTLIEGDWRINLVRVFSNPVFLSFLLLFLLECAGLLYNNDLKAGLKKVETSAGLIALPFLLITGKQFFRDHFLRIMRWFCILLLAITLFCAIHAMHAYSLTKHAEVFFYHELVSPVNHHAVYFSVFLLIAMLFLIHHSMIPGRSRNKYALNFLIITWFFVFIVMLASKLVIIASFIVLFVLLIQQVKMINKKKLLAFTGLTVLAVLLLILITNNPVKKRFTEIFQGNKTLFLQETFRTDIYFNGLQFRILAWRFGIELLNVNGNWMMGVSPGDAQHLLNQKYRETNMYIGDKNRMDTGLLNYNFHNQYLQSLVESGLAGLFALMINCLLLLNQAIKSRQREAVYTLLILLLFFLTESVLERQYGIFLYAFFPLFFMQNPVPIKPPQVDQ